jgi:predicted ATPase/DNA-binding CsgD family transcriptional regulator
VRETGYGRVRDLASGNPATVASPVNPLIGRADEMTIVRSALSGGEIRLLTLAGPAGIGKTRLALEVSGEMASAFPGGVWFVDLSNVWDVDSIPQAIVDALGLRGSSSLSALDQLHQYLGERNILFILDNFEQLEAGARVLSALLESHTKLRLLVTSRQPLHLKWEHTLTLEPLHVPRGRELRSLDSMATAPAVELFVQSARAGRLDFELTPDNARDVVAICAYLEGVPLAIELAAGWTTVLPPATISTYLRSQPSFLHTRARDVPPRQQSLDAALDWSYELLDPREQALARRLSVFFGGFTLDAAAAVAGDTVPDPLDGLADLVDRSLLQVQKDDDAAPERRFYLLETVRTFALARLEAHGEREDAQRRHALYYVSVARKEQKGIRQVGSLIAPAQLPVPDGESWDLDTLFAGLDREYANLRGALSWAQDAGEAKMELAIATALTMYWLRRPVLPERHRWLEEVIRRYPELPHVLRAHALNGVGLLFRRLGEFEHAQTLLQEALGLARDGDDARLLHAVLINLATALLGVSEAQLDAATALGREALAVAEASADDWGAAVACFYLAFGDLYERRGHYAEGYLREAFSTFDRLGDLRSSAATCLLLAAAAKLQNMDDRAISSLAEGARVARELHDPLLVASCADMAAWVIRLEDPLRAAALLGAADAIRETSFPRMPYERLLQTQVLNELKANVQQRALDSARQQGRELSVDQILDLVEAEDTIAPVPELEGVSPADLALSNREIEVIRLMSEGLSNKQIADAIFVSEGTAKLDIRSIYRKLGAHNRTQAIRIAATWGLLSEAPG